MDSVRNFKKFHVALLLIVSVVFAVVNKGSHDVQEWDESRNGVNAFEMLHNHDFINLYYDGKLDTWNAKPPLLIWMIAASYKVFGYNEFALRFPITVISILLILLVYRFVLAFSSPDTAFLTAIVLIGSKAVFGNHIGLTADFDCLLVFWMVASAFQFLKFVERGNRAAIIWSAFFLGLAFYTKGPASFLFLPGYFVYLVIKKRMRVMLSQHFVLACVLFILIAGSWILLVIKFGGQSDSSHYGTKNSIETMFVEDIYHRLTSSKFDNNQQGNGTKTFFFEVIDARMNLWNYVLWLLVALFSYRVIVSGRSYVTSYFMDRRLLLFGLSVVSPAVLVLTFSANQHNWYLAPFFPFIAYAIAYGVDYFSSRWRAAKVILAALAIFTVTRQFYYIATLPTSLHNSARELTKIPVAAACIESGIRQNVLLYLQWYNIDRLPAGADCAWSIVKTANDDGRHKWCILDDVALVQNRK